MPRGELCLQFRGLIKIKWTHEQASAGLLVGSHDTILIDQLYLEPGVEMEPRRDFVFTCANQLIFD